MTIEIMPKTEVRESYPAQCHLIRHYKVSEDGETLGIGHTREGALDRAFANLFRLNLNPIAICRCDGGNGRCAGCWDE